MIGPSLCFPEWYLRRVMYSQNLWCHPSDCHIEETYWSHLHSVFNCFWFSYFRKNLLNDILFIYASIYYTLIITNVPKYFWCGICFTLDIALVFHCISIWYCGTHDFWVTVSEVLPNMISTYVFPPLFKFSLIIYIYIYL